MSAAVGPGMTSDDSIRCERIKMRYAGQTVLGNVSLEVTRASGSASRSFELSRSTRTCWCSMSRPRLSIRSRAATSSPSSIVSCATWDFA